METAARAHEVVTDACTDHLRLGLNRDAHHLELGSQQLLKLGENRQPDLDEVFASEPRCTLKASSPQPQTIIRTGKWLTGQAERDTMERLRRRLVDGHRRVSHEIQRERVLYGKDARPR